MLFALAMGGIFFLSFLSNFFSFYEKLLYGVLVCLLFIFSLLPFGTFLSSDLGITFLLLFDSYCFLPESIDTPSSTCSTLFFTCPSTRVYFLRPDICFLHVVVTASYCTISRPAYGMLTSRLLVLVICSLHRVCLSLFRF